MASISGNETDVMLFTLEVLAPLLLGLVLVSVAANVIQTGPLLSGQALKPQLSRINPISGAKRILGKQGLLALARNLLKLTIVGGILALGLRGRFADVSRLGAGSLQEDLDRFIAMAFEITLLGAAALLVLRWRTSSSSASCTRSRSACRSRTSATRTNNRRAIPRSKGACARCDGTSSTG